MGNQSLRFAALATSLSWFAATGTLAQSAAPADPLEHIAPHERRAHVEELVKRQRAAAAQAGAAVADTTPPVLTAFESAAALNVGKADAKFKVAVKATDDMSGVRYLYFYASGPSGQQIYAYAYPGYPSKSVSMLAGFNPVSRFLQPGTWNFTYAYGYDVANNFFYVDEAGLAALGNRTFTVVNNTGYDGTAPVLTGGKVLTSAVSLTSPQPGSTQDRYIGVSLSATDTGNGAVSGFYRGYAYFCKVSDTSKCIALTGNSYATGQPATTLTVGAQVSAARGSVAGEYELYYVSLYDWAGNYTYLLSNKFGGPVDFSAYFPNGTKITLNP
jgi:hypothetical protein